MSTYFRLMHGATARVVRLFGGLWLVIYAAQRPPVFAFTVALVGTAIAVTGIADICVTELIVNAARRHRSGSQQRAA
jgi:hypothetical protein